MTLIWISRAPRMKMAFFPRSHRHNTRPWSADILPCLDMEQRGNFVVSWWRVAFIKADFRSNMCSLATMPLQARKARVKDRDHRSDAGYHGEVNPYLFGFPTRKEPQEGPEKNSINLWWWLDDREPQFSLLDEPTCATRGGLLIFYILFCMSTV